MRMALRSVSKRRSPNKQRPSVVKEENKHKEDSKSKELALLTTGTADHQLRTYWLDRKKLAEEAGHGCPADAAEDDDGCTNDLEKLTSHFLLEKLEHQLGEACVRELALWWNKCNACIAGSWVIADVVGTYTAQDLDFWVATLKDRTTLRTLLRPYGWYSTGYVRNLFLRSHRVSELPNQSLLAIARHTVGESVMIQENRKASYMMRNYHPWEYTTHFHEQAQPPKEKETSALDAVVRLVRIPGVDVYVNPDQNVSSQDSASAMKSPSSKSKSNFNSKKTKKKKTKSKSKSSSSSSSSSSFHSSTTTSPARAPNSAHAQLNEIQIMQVKKEFHRNKPLGVFFCREHFDVLTASASFELRGKVEYPKKKKSKSPNTNTKTVESKNQTTPLQDAHASEPLVGSLFDTDTKEKAHVTNPSEPTSSAEQNSPASTSKTTDEKVSRPDPENDGDSKSDSATDTDTSRFRSRKKGKVKKNKKKESISIDKPKPRKAREKRRSYPAGRKVIVTPLFSHGHVDLLEKWLLDQVSVFRLKEPCMQRCFRRYEKWAARLHLKLPPQALNVLMDRSLHNTIDSERLLFVCRPEDPSAHPDRWLWLHNPRMANGEARRGPLRGLVAGDEIILPSASSSTIYKPCETSSTGKNCCMLTALDLPHVHLHRKLQGRWITHDIVGLHAEQVEKAQYPLVYWKALRRASVAPVHERMGIDLGDLTSTVLSYLPFYQAWQLGYSILERGRTPAIADDLRPLMEAHKTLGASVRSSNPSFSWYVDRFRESAEHAPVNVLASVHELEETSNLHRRMRACESITRELMDANLAMDRKADGTLLKKKEEEEKAKAKAKPSWLVKAFQDVKEAETRQERRMLDRLDLSTNSAVLTAVEELTIFGPLERSKLEPVIWPSWSSLSEESIVWDTIALRYLNIEYVTPREFPLVHQGLYFPELLHAVTVKARDMGLIDLSDADHEWLQGWKDTAFATEPIFFRNVMPSEDLLFARAHGDDYGDDYDVLRPGRGNGRGHDRSRSRSRSRVRVQIHQRTSQEGEPTDAKSAALLAMSYALLEQTDTKSSAASTEQTDTKLSGQRDSTVDALIQHLQRELKVMEANITHLNSHSDSDSESHSHSTTTENTANARTRTGTGTTTNAEAEAEAARFPIHSYGGYITLGSREEENKLPVLPIQGHTLGRGRGRGRGQPVYRYNQLTCVFPARPDRILRCSFPRAGCWYETYSTAPHKTGEKEKDIAWPITQGKEKTHMLEGHPSNLVETLQRDDLHVAYCNKAACLWKKMLPVGTTRHYHIAESQSVYPFVSISPSHREQQIWYLREDHRSTTKAMILRKNTGSSKPEQKSK
jgi:hypothetical protein